MRRNLLTYRALQVKSRYATDCDPSVSGEKSVLSELLTFS
jgi:hypothetical protein